MNSPSKSVPELAVILVTPGPYQTIRRTVSALRMQTARARLELVIVCPSKEKLQINDAEMAEFCSVRIVELHPVRTLAAPRAAGINAATAPLVALGEDHAFPQPDWAESLIRAHQQCCGAVGPAFLNANPGLMSWLCLVMDYGRWIDPVACGATDDVPGHNSAWKRSLLLEYGPALERMLQAPTVMHWDMHAKGHQLYLESAAKISHVNITRPLCFHLDHFYGARVFASARASGWPWTRRLLYAAAAPMFMIRKARTWHQNICRLGLESELLPKAWPVLLLSAAGVALGETLGYIFGAGRAEQRIFGYDANRSQYVASRDREVFRVD